MLKPALRKLAHVSVALMLALTGTAGHAQDTEIYFNSGVASGNTDSPLIPNVLFILDTSGSMQWAVSGGTESRISVLKDAMTTILSDLEDVNIGIERFTNDDGGAIIFPITYIDADSTDVVGEASTAYTNTITDGNDDSEESNTNGSVVLTDSTLEMTQQTGSAGGNFDVTYQVVDDSDDAEEKKCTGYSCGKGTMNLTSPDLDSDNTQYMGVRFPGVSIPQGATINSASLEFTLRNDHSSTSTRIDIYIQQTDDADPISSAKYDITDRVYYSGGSNKFNWTYVKTGNRGDHVRTDDSSVTSGDDLADLVQQVINRPGWVSGNAIMFELRQDNNSVQLLTKDGADSNVDGQSYSSADYPTLHINYTIPGVPALDQTVALRFQNVTIPSSATIDSATLTFTPAADDSGTTDWVIKAEAADDSAALTTTTNDITARTLTSAAVNWSVPAWTAGTAVTVNVKDLVAEVTSRESGSPSGSSGWCGGNALTFVVTGTGLRRAKSADAVGSQGPVLTYSYSNSGTGTACTQAQDTAQMGASSHDVEEASDGSIDRNGGTLNINSNQWIGLRFTGVQVPQGATILSAYMKFRANGSDSSSVDVTIHGEDEDSAAVFGTSTNEVSGRNMVSDTVSWTPGNWSYNSYYDTPDISAIVQDIVDRSGSPGWQSGNDMAFMLEASGSGERRAKSYDTSANDSARLYITYKTTATATTKTVRQSLIDLVNDLPAHDSTPIVEVMYEAAHYWRGDSVKYGLTRDNDRYSRVSHPGSYCTDSSTCPGADLTNYPNYGIETPAGCDESVDPNNSDCAGMKIHGTPDYISPFKSTLSCQKNYQVFLTDGSANSSGSTVRSNISNEFLNTNSCLSTNRAGNAYDTDEVCGVDVAKFLYEEDQSSDLDNDQNVITYTVAFNLTDAGATQFLKDMAYYGTGGSSSGFYEASNAADLVEVFQSILTDVKNDPTSFVAPSLATNAFNRLLSRDEVYFGLFTPSLDKGWFGNVKKYGICIDSNGSDGVAGTSDDCTLGEILDASGGSAVSSADNKFLTDSTSVWSDVQDGRATTKGGVGGQMLDWTTRTIYTDGSTAPTNGTALNTSGHLLNKDTWADGDTSYVRDIICPVNSTVTGTTDGDDCKQRWDWMLGMIVNADADNDPSATTRWSVNDVLHSSPSVITYGAKDSNSDGTLDTFYDKIVVGTNDGGLRFVNGGNTANGGNEEWEFLPTDTLSNQQQLFAGVEGDHLYGMDLTPTIRIVDNNGDGSIDPTSPEFDKVQVFSAMRRGGNEIYALDVSGTSKMTAADQGVIPKFMWKITGGSSDFKRLGLTFSQPRLATIQITNSSNAVVSKDVLIFGGGYDDALDNGFGTTPTSGANNMGNAVYIVDPDDGSLVLSIAGDDGVVATKAAEIEIPEMKYSVPGRIAVLDSDGDGFDDRLYFGDTGGQVWRVDLTTDIKPSDATAPQGSVVVGRLAAVSTAGTASKERRFFEPPSIVQVRDTEYSDAANGEYDYVLIGSGNRAHPLDDDVSDQFYAFRDTNIGPLTDSTDGDATDNYDKDYPLGATSTPITATDTDLFNASSSFLVPAGSSTAETGAVEVDATVQAKHGWYYDFDSGSSTDGEKVLSAPVTIAGTVFFTTYQPDATNNLDACSANIGGGSAYEFNILNAAATLDWNLDNAVSGLADRSKSLGGGIPSDVVPVFTKEGIVGIVGIEGGAAQLGSLSDLPRYRTYWYEETDT